MKPIAIVLLCAGLSIAFADTKKEQKQRGYLDLRFAQALGRSSAGRFGNAAQVPSTVKLSPSPQLKKPVQVFQNEPVITRSVYNEANRRARNAAIATGSAATAIAFVGLGFHSAKIGQGINYGLILRAPRWAIVTGIATYFIVKPYFRDHAIKWQLNKK